MKKKLNKKLLILAIALIIGLSLFSIITLYIVTDFDNGGWLVYVFLTLNPLLYYLSRFIDVDLGMLGISLLVILQYLILVPAFILLYKWLIKRTKELCTGLVIIILLIPILILLGLGSFAYNDIVSIYHEK